MTYEARSINTPHFCDAKDMTDKVSAAVVLASSIAIALILLYVPDGRHSFWLIPLCLFSTTAFFSRSAYGSRQSALPKHASQAFFWLSLFAAMVTGIVAALGGT